MKEIARGREEPGRGQAWSSGGGGAVVRGGAGRLSEETALTALRKERKTESANLLRKNRVGQKCADA